VPVALCHRGPGGPAQALEQGIYSYQRVLALTEALFADALQAVEAQASREQVTAATPSPYPAGIFWFSLLGRQPRPDRRLAAAAMPEEKIRES